jgi:hypothetical protein
VRSEVSAIGSISATAIRVAGSVPPKISHADKTQQQTETFARSRGGHDAIG